ncbi:zinc finger protein 236 isoform X1 [Strongylocentrotus purpuratus]|uniref:C2H2-type domain-containing protein n=1 Tax=Strongylocentrotus purpuratus TaxID=7668 RepID=A0A7M7NKG0_STRPU|nr:zinc finger protein 236 isoform X1 [Strongylocentrotus purpuratus]
MARHSLVKPFKCGHCDYSAITMTQMHTHIAKHTGIKQYSCDLCSYSTANKQHLTNHMSKHSNLRYKCNACGHITAWKDRMRVHLKQHEQGRIVGRSVKSSLQPHGSTGLQVLSGEGGQLVTTDGQVLQVLNVIGSDGTQHIEGSETLVVMNQLADRIQEEFIAIGEGEDQGEAVGQGEEQSEVQNEDDGIAVGGEEIIGNQQEQIVESEAQLVSQGESEDGTLMIVTDHDGSDLHLRLTGTGLQSSKVGSVGLELCNESTITSTAVRLRNATATVTEISGEAT